MGDDQTPHVHIIDFKLDLCTCMCMRHLLVFEFNNDGMLKKERERERATGSLWMFMGPHLPHATHTALHNSLMNTYSLAKLMKPNRKVMGIPF